MLKALALALPLLFGAAAPAAASPVLAKIIADFEAYERREDPISAGFEGERAALSRLPEASPAAAARRKAALTEFRARLDALPETSLDGEQRLNRGFLRSIVDERLTDIGFDTDRMPFTSDSGFHTLAGYLADATTLRDAADARAYLARLEALPRYYAENIANVRRGVRTGFVQPRITAESVLEVARAHAAAPAETDPLLKPFATLPASVPEAERAQFRAQAQQLIAERIRPAQREFAELLEREYLPKARRSLAAADLPDGRRYYAFRVRSETTMDLTPDRVHTLGQQEVARIRSEMEKVIAETGFQGSFPEFLAMLRTDPRFYATTREDLLEKAAEIAKRADDQLPRLFRTLPRLSYGVRPVPADIEARYTTGRYFQGSPELGRAGGYMVNTSRLDQRPLYELPALTLHEAAPGHHTQIALAQERKDLPWFRRNASVTAYTEGWGLYAEHLGEEMGIYRDPYERFGRLSYEMWRACRLVADTGIHWKRWTKDQAKACFLENSALAPHNIDTEVDRYISWPGQALAYKLGELRIKAFRRKAEEALGPKFDVRSFHDAVLLDGPVPMNLLEQRIDAWIAKTKAEG